MNRPAIFFDRDNTLIVNDAYLGDPGGVVLVSGAAQAIARARALGYAVITVSNQAGVARGKFTEEAIHLVNSRMDEMLLDQHPNARIDRHEYCPYHPEGVVERYKQESDLRKPKPGMMLRAADRLSLDLARSWMIGDTPRDIEAGKAAGCRTILFADPSIKPSWSVDDPSPVKPDFTVSSLEQALDIIEQNKMSNVKSETQITSEEVAALSSERKEEPAVTEPAAETSAGTNTAVADTGAEEATAAAAPAVATAPASESPQAEHSAASEAEVPETPPPAAADPHRRMTFAERVKAGTYQPARSTGAGVVVAERPKRAVVGSETAPATSESPAAAPTAKALAPGKAAVTEPGMKPTEPVGDSELLEPILQQILEEVRMMRQQHPGTEFAVTKLLAGIVQVLVLPALFFAYLNRGTAADFQSLILLATFLQTLTIALLIMGRQQ